MWPRSELQALESRQASGTTAQTQLRDQEEQLSASLSRLDADSERTADEMSAQRESDLATALGRAEGMVERARGLSGVLRERQRSLAQALDAAADADVVSTLEAESARLAEELEAGRFRSCRAGARSRIDPASRGGNHGRARGAPRVVG
jgi:chromosome segregation ATPase